MDVSRLSIAGALTIVPQTFADERGYFKETFSASRYALAGTAASFVQDNISQSMAHVLRGMHGDPRMAKLLQVLHGRAFDVIVDVRRESATYLQWHGLVLEARKHTQLYIPAGCLHGFLALEDDTVLMYKQTAEYDPSQEIGVAWDDPDLAIAWPLGDRPPILSRKDANNPTLRELGYL